MTCWMEIQFNPNILRGEISWYLIQCLCLHEKSNCDVCLMTFIVTFFLYIAYSSFLLFEETFYKVKYAKSDQNFNQNIDKVKSAKRRKRNLRSSSEVKLLMRQQTNLFNLAWAFGTVFSSSSNISFLIPPKCFSNWEFQSIWSKR